MARRGGGRGLFAESRTTGFRGPVERIRDELLEILARPEGGREGSLATALRHVATRCSTTTGSADDTLDYIVDRNPLKQGLVLTRNAHPGGGRRRSSPRTIRTTCS